MLRDLLRGRPRDITPHNRPTCFDSMGGGGGVHVLSGTTVSELKNTPYADILAWLTAGEPVFFSHVQSSSVAVFTATQWNKAKNRIVFVNTGLIYDGSANNIHTIIYKSSGELEEKSVTVTAAT